MENGELASGVLRVCLPKTNVVDRASSVAGSCTGTDCVPAMGAAACRSVSAYFCPGKHALQPLTSGAIRHRIRH